MTEEKLWPILVPSKGRYATSKLLPLASNYLSIDLTLLVEPQEAKEYTERYPQFKVHVLEQNNQGITYVRNAALKLARERGLSWFWMIDDDVSNFYQAAAGRCAIMHMDRALLAVQKLANDDVGQVALEYQQFAWSALQSTKRNSYCDVCVGIRVDTGLNYRPVDLKEDRDFTMQTIHSGLDAVRSCEYAFAAPKNGSNKGGLHAEYAMGRDAQAAEKLSAQWPWCCSVQTKPSGRIDAKIAWSKIRVPASP